MLAFACTEHRDKTMIVPPLGSTACVHDSFMASLRYSAAFSAGGGLAMLAAAPLVSFGLHTHLRTSRSVVL